MGHFCKAKGISDLRNIHAPGCCLLPEWTVKYGGRLSFLKRLQQEHVEMTNILTDLLRDPLKLALIKLF